MSPQETKRQKRLEQVRALLAKANGTDFPEEAATFREKADQLMVMYAIEEWQISAATPLGRPEPEMRIFDMSWWTYRNPFKQELWELMDNTAKHCRCVCVFWDWVPRQMKVVGLPADLDYFDLLFTQLMLEHAKRLEPKPDPSGEVGHEVFKLRQAGLDWKRIVDLIYRAGLVKLTPVEVRMLGSYEWDEARRWNVDLVNHVRNRLANANRRYVKEHGLQGQRNYVHPKVYQRSFSQGFVGEINSRMRRMRRESEEEKTGDNSMALALRDIRAVVIQWTDANFPRPEEDNEKKSKAVAREVAFDWSAYNAGSRAGKEVNISANPSQGLRSQKELKR